MALGRREKARAVVVVFVDALRRDKKLSSFPRVQRVAGRHMCYDVTNSSVALISRITEMVLGMTPSRQARASPKSTNL